ncbi:MAG: heat-inducible transcriptional repressor HrcA [Thermodesulfovibrionales bacterium]
MLDERSKQVLIAVIQCYINSPGPVGSRAVTKKFPFGLSPATIRNIMSDLEDIGFLRQPHTSAGRVPTDIGYRFYVDTITAQKQTLDSDFESEMQRRLESIRKDINVFLDDAAKMLSSMSHYLGVTLSPHPGTTTLNKIELIKYKGDHAAVILFTEDGIIRNKIIRTDPDISQQDLNRLSEYINRHFTGYALDEIKKVIISEMTRERVLCDSLISEAIKICQDVFAAAPGNVYISGMSEMLTLPDFCDISRIKELMATIEDKHIMVKLLDKLADTEGTQIFIGSENPLDEMKKFSLVAATYKEGNRPIGAVGIIGPTRMNYANAISIVDVTAKFITAMLSYK